MAAFSLKFANIRQMGPRWWWRLAENSLKRSQMCKKICQIGIISIYSQLRSLPRYSVQLIVTVDLWAGQREWCRTSIPSTVRQADVSLSSVWQVYRPPSSSVTRQTTRLKVPFSLVSKLYLCPWKISRWFLNQRSLAFGLEYWQDNTILLSFSTHVTSTISSIHESYTNVLHIILTNHMF